MILNPLIKRQLLKSGFTDAHIEKASNDYLILLNIVNETYNDFDEDRVLLERSIDISAREYNDKIEQIKSLQSSVIYNEKMAGIGQLSAGIAHEINNPLGFIRSNIETLSKYLIKINQLNEFNNKLLDAQDAKEMEQIVLEIKNYVENSKLKIIFEDMNVLIDETLTGISRITEIVKSLLSFSRKINSNDLEDYDLNKGIEDTLVIAFNEIKYYATVTKELGEIPIIKAKSGEINQVILNILINAVHAIKSQNINGKITVKTYSDDKFVNCEITDNGCGIPKENLQRIFDPFFTTKPVGTGTGLGLSISYDIIVNKHNGKLNVNSIPSKGTSFIISLPIYDDFSSKEL